MRWVTGCRAAGLLSFVLCTWSFVFTSCADHWDDFTPKHEEESSITFAGAVYSSQMATRADASLINRKEYHLHPTAVSGKYVGVFGAFTGQNTWAEYKTANSKEPAADLFFNQQAEIGTVANGRNTLTYTPLRFWSNNKVGTTSDYEYASFWAYYPYNATGDPGTNGIAIVPNTTSPYGIKDGMGSIKFTMHSDAAEQNDFMISDLVTDRSRLTNPLMSTSDGYFPTPVPFTFHHMLAQVRVYAYIKGTDKVVYLDANGDGNPDIANATWFDSWATDGTIKDVYGNVYTKKGADEVEQTTTGKPSLTKDQFVALELKIPDETNANTVRWKRLTTADKDGSKFADVNYSLSFNNIYTTSIFTPSYNTTTGETKFASAVLGSATGSVTVNSYLPNPYWFTFDGDNQRVMLNDNYIFDYFEEAPSNNGGDTNAMGYQLTTDNADRTGETVHSGHHYNYAPGNILMVVPQSLTDDDVPHVIITISGKGIVWDSSLNGGAGDWKEVDASAKVTVNLLNMAIKWESGYIYCYAFLDDLAPGDDKVRGPESITAIFDPTRNTDQW